MMRNFKISFKFHCQFIYPCKIQVSYFVDSPLRNLSVYHNLWDQHDSQWAVFCSQFVGISEIDVCFVHECVSRYYSVMCDILKMVRIYTKLYYLINVHYLM